jgi:DnaK suppressor protein
VASKPASRAAKPAAPAKPKAAAGKAKPAAKPAPKTVKAVSKPVAKAAAKTSVNAPAKRAALKPTPKNTVPVKATSKAASKPVAKPVAKPAAKTVARKPAPAKAATKESSKKTVAATPAASAKPSVKKPAAPVVSAAPVAPPPKVAATRATSAAKQGGVVDLADKMKTTVASKVSEVMTKTMKPSPAPNTDGRLLTEAEILAMSEKDYMNPAQLAFFKARLQQLEKDLLKNAGETTEHLRETVLVPDPADRATIEEEHALELRTRDRERKLLKKVQQSIVAIDGGDYGWCEETGEPIGIPRLIARPTATLSLEAQQRRELKQKLYGD